MQFGQSKQRTHKNQNTLEQHRKITKKKTKHKIQPPEFCEPPLLLTEQTNEETTKNAKTETVAGDMIRCFMLFSIREMQRCSSKCFCWGCWSCCVRPCRTEKVVLSDDVSRNSRGATFGGGMPKFLRRKKFRPWLMRFSRSIRPTQLPRKIEAFFSFVLSRFWLSREAERSKLPTC